MHTDGIHQIILLLKTWLGVETEVAPYHTEAVQSTFKINDPGKCALYFI